MKQLGKRLRTLREGIGLSQSKFADVIGSTQSSINRYENSGAYVSSRVKDGCWGKSVIANFAKFLQAHYPGTKRFSAQMIPGWWQKCGDIKRRTARSYWNCSANMRKKKHISFTNTGKRMSGLTVRSLQHCR